MLNYSDTWGSTFHLAINAIIKAKLYMSGIHDLLFENVNTRFTLIITNTNKIEGVTPLLTLRLFLKNALLLWVKITQVSMVNYFSMVVVRT